MKNPQKWERTVWGAYRHMYALEVLKATTATNTQVTLLCSKVTAMVTTEKRRERRDLQNAFNNNQKQFQTFQSACEAKGCRDPSFFPCSCHYNHLGGIRTFQEDSSFTSSGAKEFFLRTSRFISGSNHVTVHFPTTWTVPAAFQKDKKKNCGSTVSKSKALVCQENGEIIQ